MSCSHQLPEYWAVAGTDARGYTKVVCRVCKRFIGYRPPAELLSGSKQGGGDEDDVMLATGQSQSPAGKSKPRRRRAG